MASPCWPVLNLPGDKIIYTCLSVCNSINTFGSRQKCCPVWLSVFSKWRFPFQTLNCFETVHSILMTWALSILRSCREAQSDSICARWGLSSHIWINKGFLAPVSRAPNAVAKACLSDYWRAGCLPQNVLPAVVESYPGRVLIALYKRGTLQTPRVSKRAAWLHLYQGPCRCNQILRQPRAHSPQLFTVGNFISWKLQVE